MYFIFQFRGKFIGGRVSELKRMFCCIFMAFLLLLYDVGWSWPLFIVGGYRVFLQSSSCVVVGCGYQGMCYCSMCIGGGRR